MEYDIFLKSSCLNSDLARHVSPVGVRLTLVRTADALMIPDSSGLMLTTLDAPISMFHPDGPLAPSWKMVHNLPAQDKFARFVAPCIEGIAEPLKLLFDPLATKRRDVATAASRRTHTALSPPVQQAE